MHAKGEATPKDHLSWLTTIIVEDRWVPANQIEEQPCNNYTLRLFFPSCSSGVNDIEHGIVITEEPIKLISRSVGLVYLIDCYN